MVQTNLVLEAVTWQIYLPWRWVSSWVPHCIHNWGHSYR